jgi:CIC family chloride channel protein
MDYMKQFRAWLERSTPLGLLFLGIIVGLGGALGATLFHALIYLSSFTFYGYDGSSDFITLVGEIPTWQRILIPTLGGLLVGIIFKIMNVTEAEGEGVPEVMESLSHQSGRIRPIVAPVKIITAALTIGSGGSAGREGPVIQIGSAIGSGIAQITKQGTRERSLLLAAGAAAGIGGTFGAPIAGVLFTLEILRHRPSLLRTSVIIIAALIGSIGTTLLTGRDGLQFIAPEEFDVSIILIIALCVLGVLSAFAAVIFGNTLKALRLIFKKIALPHLLKPALGGFFIGLISIYVPYIHEPAAYPFLIDMISLSSLPISLLCGLLFIKMIATGITLGSGGSGGIFAPLLLMGAIVGSVLGGGLLMLDFIDASTIPLLVILGMAGVFAGAAHAPLTASFIIYEMTGESNLLPLLLLTCFIATMMAKRITSGSVYAISESKSPTTLLT